MNRLMPSAAPEIDHGTQEEPPRSAPAVIYALLTGSSGSPLGLEDWLGQIAHALSARHAALVAFLDSEPVVQHFFSAEQGPQENVSWPWTPTRQTLREFLATKPAVPTLSADGRSSLLTAAVHHGGLIWVFRVEDAPSRAWSEDDRAALTLAATALFQVAPIPESATRWERWLQQGQTQKRLEEVAAAMARLVHDFNNVLTSVLGFSELSLSQLPAGTPARDFTAEVYRAAQHGQQFLQQLNFFGARKRTAANSTTTLALLMGEIEEQLCQTWGEAVRLEVCVPADLPQLAIDVDSFRVLLHQLLNNACEAIRTTGTVQLSARAVQLTREDCLGMLGKACPGSFIEITVADSGDGLDAAVQQRMFVPFVSTKPSHRGLGLAAVYGILRNCGGGIRLENGPQKGARAYVYLPTVAAMDGDRTREDGLFSSQLGLATQGETRGKSST